MNLTIEIQRVRQEIRELKALYEEFPDPDIRDELLNAQEYLMDLELMEYVEGGEIDDKG